MTDPLSELLRKCHRDELLPLARALRIKPAGMGLRALADHVAATLRQRGANQIENLVTRGGSGPPYQNVVARLARRLGTDVGETQANELALMRQWWLRRWAKANDTQRQLLLAEVDSPPLPEEADVALKQLQRHWTHNMGFGIGLAVSQLAVMPLAPLWGCVGFWWLAKPDDELLLAAVLEVGRLRQLVHHRVTVGLVGSPSSGKDAAIRAIFGIDSGNINPVAGSTKAVEITRLPNATALYVVNTPGLGDVVEEVTEEARQVLDHIDLYLYVINAQGGVQARELADYQSCLASGRPVLAVVNKVDTLRASDQQRYLEDAQSKLNAADDGFLSAAFDPLPQLSESPIGVDAVRQWMEEQLRPLGKDVDELPWRKDTPTPAKVAP